MLKDSLNRVFTVINFLLLTFIFLLIFSPIIGLSNTATAILTMVMAFVFMFLHGVIGWGVRNILIFILSFPDHFDRGAISLIFLQTPYHTVMTGPFSNKNDRLLLTQSITG